MLALLVLHEVVVEELALDVQLALVIHVRSLAPQARLNQQSRKCIALSALIGHPRQPTAGDWFPSKLDPASMSQT